MESRRALALVAQDFRAALREWLVRPAGEVAFLETDVAEHAFDERDVLGLAAVRRARHGQLLVFPSERVEDCRS